MKIILVIYLLFTALFENEKEYFRKGMRQVCQYILLDLITSRCVNKNIKILATKALTKNKLHSVILYIFQKGAFFSSPEVNLCRRLKENGKKHFD